MQMFFKKRSIMLFLLFVLVFTLALTGCGIPENQQGLQEQDEPNSLEGKLNPMEWAEKFPNHYASYQTNAEGGSDHSKYRGSDDFDRISAWPFQWVLYDGWGMGVEYNESRGHVYALTDQLKVASQRVGAGGACLTCKSPAVPGLKEEMGTDYFRLPYDEVYSKIPAEHNEVGIACIDCHDTQTMDLKLSRWTLEEALDSLDNVPPEFTEDQMASLVCAQCHVTYSIPKDENKKSIDVTFPWSNSEWENITIEDIEKQIIEEGLYEWTHGVTGMKLGHIRHPEFELFTNNSFHYNMGLNCASCHMPEEEVNGETIASHQWTSPFKQGLKACASCHSQSAAELKKRVVDIQDEINELFTEAGFTAAQAAKAIEMANNTEGRDNSLLEAAKEAYERAYYRVVFIGAENSMGFHNPPEARRVLNDGLALAKEAEEKARTAIEAAGVTPPEKFDLELEKYPFKPEENRSHEGREQ